MFPVGFPIAGAALGAEKMLESRESVYNNVHVLKRVFGVPYSRFCMLI